MTARKWEKVGEYRWVCEPWTVTAYEVGDVTMHALWRGEDSHATSYSEDRGALMHLAKTIEEQEGKANA